ncbi:MAG: hypothetical protein AAFZ63_17170 [Bacteroidota bacterium]
MRKLSLIALLLGFLCPFFLLAQTPDITQTDGTWTYGWGNSGGEDFHDFDGSGDYVAGSPVIKRDKAGSYWSAAQNTSETAWQDTRNSVTFPPISIGAIALHPGNKANEYAKVRYTAPASGEYNVSVKFEALDEQFTRAKAEIWTNSGASWEQKHLIALTVEEYEGHHGKIERKFTIRLSKGEMISVELECDGDFYNDYTLVTLEAKKKADDIPDISKTSERWSYGYGNSGGEDFHPFEGSRDYTAGSPVIKRDKAGTWWSAAQNTSDTQWEDTGHSVTFPPKSFGAIALHPGQNQNEYSKVRYTALADGQYTFAVRFNALDEQFTKAKAEVWTNSGGSWNNKETIALTAEAYESNWERIEREYTINLKAGEIISVELERDGNYQNDFTLVTLGVTEE